MKMVRYEHNVAQLPKPEFYPLALTSAPPPSASALLANAMSCIRKAKPVLQKQRFSQYVHKVRHKVRQHIVLIGLSCK